MPEIEGQCATTFLLPYISCAKEPRQAGSYTLKVVEVAQTFQIATSAT